MISNSNILKKNQLFLSSSLPLGQAGSNDSKFGVFSSQSEEFPFSSIEKTKKQSVQNEQKNLAPLAPQSESQFLQNASQYRAMTLLHPLQFYFQKEQALKRKFQFYGVNLFRNFGVENNAPYFRVFMKRFFYHYKPSLRWERTLRVATYRRARRKTSRIPRKFNVPKSSQILAQFQPINGAVDSGENFNSLNEMKNRIALQSGDSKKNQKTLQTIESQQFDLPTGFTPSGITDPTHFYSLVDKRASRYRFQIYKDVLQHWYYSPLNRLLLKLDIDSFIRRQPNSYFLTKNDEKFA